MRYIVCGNHNQGLMYARGKRLPPREYILIHSVESCFKLRGRMWKEGDSLEYIGTWYERDYTTIRRELLLLRVPDELLN